MHSTSAEGGERSTGRLRVKKMKLSWRASWCLHKNSSSVLKLAGLFLLVGFGFRILSRSRTDSLDRIAAESLDRTETPLVIDMNYVPEPPATIAVSPPAKGNSPTPSEDQVTGEGNPNVAAFLVLNLLWSADLVD